MTTGDSFSGALKSALQKDATSVHDKAYKKLLELAKDLASTISEDSDHQVRAVLEPGHTTHRGQQFPHQGLLPVAERRDHILPRSYPSWRFPSLL